MSHYGRKSTFRYVRPAKIHLRIREIRLESSLTAFWTTKDANNEAAIITKTRLFKYIENLTFKK